ncbi:MAG: GIY-YIG nuclease family protein [Planctomycetes bacterium]|nr:GIY-YIG nuclease family protein [Planctomycetota bacterium]
MAESTWHVYIAELADGRYYVGMTGHPPPYREREHRLGRGGLFTRGTAVRRILWYESLATRLQARQREMQLKRWSRAKKQALIAEDMTRLKDLSRCRGR